MLRSDLCSNCQDLLKDKVIVDNQFMKYLFIKADLSEIELQELQKETKVPHYHNHHHHNLIKADTPNFTVDKKKGEGKAQKMELDLRQELFNQLEKCYHSFEKIREDKKLNQKDKINKIKPITDKFIKDSQNIIKEYIPKIWEMSSQLAIDKLKENDIEVDENIETKKDVFDSLLEWQLFKAEMNGEYLRLDLTNKIYGNNYFMAAYGE